MSLLPREKIRIGRPKEWLIAILAGALFCLAIECSYYSIPVTWPRAMPIDESRPPFHAAEVNEFIIVPADWMHPSQYWIAINAQISSVTINGVEMRNLLLGGANDNVDKFNLKSFLTQRLNIIHIAGMATKDKKPMFYFYPLVQGLYAFSAICMMASTALGCWLLGLLLPTGWSFAERGILLFGSVIRIAYMTATPYFVRSHDMNGHLTYIQYLIDKANLPAVHNSWESFQPPLYYMVSAVIVQMALELGGCANFAIHLLQIEASTCSIVVLGCCIWVGRKLFERTGDRLSFAAICAVFPALIFSAGQINNDVFCNVVSFAFVGLLLCFMADGSSAGWYKVAVLLGLGLLVKNSDLILIIIAFICLCQSALISWRQKIIYAAMGVGIIAALSGWFQIPRWLGSHDEATFVVGNIAHINNKLRFSPTLAKFVEFNPIKVVASPFYSRPVEMAERDSFPEFYLKSALFGQWSYDAIYLLSARIMVVTTIFLIPVIVIGFMCSIFQQSANDRVLGAITMICLTAQIGWIWQAPYESSEDFRYFTILILPATYYLLRIIRHLPAGAKIAVQATAAAAIVGSFCFITLVCIFQS